MHHGLRRHWRALLITLLWPLCTGALAQQPTTQFVVEVGAGYETQTSPLFQLSPESTLVYPGDLNRLSGSHALTNVQAQTDWAGEDGISASLSASANLKRSFNNPDFDFMALSLQPSVHMPVGSSSAGLGMTLQSTEVARHHFRDTAGVQLDWTHADGDGLWGLVLEHAVYRHEEPLSDLDASAQSLVLLHQISNPLPGLEGIDLTAIFGREANAHGYDDLSQTSTMLVMALHWKFLQADWTGSTAWRQARFDDSAFPGEPAREDHSVFFDLSAEWALSPKQTIRLSFNDARNRSSTALYDNMYQQLSVLLRSSF